MENNISRIEERQFITKEFADALAGKTPAPYLRVHDPAQQALVVLGQECWIFDMKRKRRSWSKDLVGRAESVLDLEF